MDQDLKAKWVAALRSGDYKQGVHEFFPTSDTYCCLGVLCAVAGGVGVGNYEGYNFVEKEVGLNYLDDIRPLEQMNDGGSSFAEIADYIEENL